jgi:hypothetical protein
MTSLLLTTPHGLAYLTDEPHACKCGHYTYWFVCIYGRTYCHECAEESYDEAV